MRPPREALTCECIRHQIMQPRYISKRLVVTQKSGSSAFIPTFRARVCEDYAQAAFQQLSLSNTQEQCNHCASAWSYRRGYWTARLRLPWLGVSMMRAYRLTILHGGMLSIGEDDGGKLWWKDIPLALGFNTLNLPRFSRIQYTYFGQGE